MTKVFSYTDSKLDAFLLGRDKCFRVKTQNLDLNFACISCVMLPNLSGFIYISVKVEIILIMYYHCEEKIPYTMNSIILTHNSCSVNEQYSSNVVN